MSSSLIITVAFMSIFSGISASGCQRDCDCAFDWSIENDDADVTLRYEVMAGLIGGFAPLVIGGLGLLIYKLCAKSAANAATNIPPADTNNPFNSNPWRQQDPNQVSPRGGKAPPAYASGGRSTPISLYGESDDDLMPGNSISQVGSNGLGDSPLVGGNQAGGRRPGTVGSRYTNIHRNVKDDLTNKWFKNVNLMVLAARQNGK